MVSPNTLQQALLRLQNLCSRSEKCIADVRKKLVLWQINIDESDEIISILIENKYIDENRYAEAFVNDKSKFAHWGNVKIKTALKAKNIPEAIISKALRNIDQTHYKNELEAMLFKKIKNIKADSLVQLKAKLIRFGLSRGFEYDLVYACVSELLNNND